MKGYTYFKDDEKTVAVSNDTGEVLDTVNITIPVGSIVYTPDSQAAYKERKERELQKAVRLDANKDLGHFYFLKHDHELGKISAETVGRMIYLFTFLAYDKRFMYAKDKPICKSDLPEVMKLSDSSIKRFWREISPLYIDKNKKGELILTNDDIVRGGLKNDHEIYQKCYIEKIREIYLKLKPTKHRYLGYIYQVLPYINIEYNVVCRNPYETELNNIIPMSIGEFCMKIDFDASNFHRLKKIYKDITFEINNEEQYFLSFVNNESTEDGIKMFVNPHVLFSGSDYRKVEVLGWFAKNQRKKDSSFLTQNNKKEKYPKLRI